jgi:hypothetical protein
MKCCTGKDFREFSPKYEKKEIDKGEKIRMSG